MNFYNLNYWELWPYVFLLWKNKIYAVVSIFLKIMFRAWLNEESRVLRGDSMCHHTNNSRLSQRVNPIDQMKAVGFVTLFSFHDYAKCCYCFTQYLTWGTLWIPFAALFSYSLNGFFSLRGHSHSFLKNYQNNQVHLMNWYKSLRLNFKGHLLSSVIFNK